MKNFLRAVVLFFVLFQVGQANGQQDTLFWFAAPEVSASIGDNPIYLRLLSFGSPATVTVSQPANLGFTPIVVNLAANDNDSINLTPFLASIESPAADVVSNTGLKITSTADITAYYELKANNNKEYFSLKGTAGIGTNFYTPFQKFWNNGVTAPASFSSIEIVATQDNTTVLITPRANVVGHAVNMTYQITLNEGETYSARDIDLMASTSLAGSIVSSDKPVAVTVFNGALDNSGCLSAQGDQITTAEFGGTDFIIHKGTAADERVSILAIQNGTNITITNNSGTTTTLINWSETYEFALTDTVNYIQTSKPVYAWHSSGYGCKLSGAQVPNLFCAGTYSSVFTRSSSDSLGLLLYTRTGFEDDFAINGNGALVPPAAFLDVPGTSGAFKVALIYYNTTDIPIGSYNEVTNTGDVFGLGVLNGGLTNGSSYAYLSEFISFPFVDAGLDATICANTPFSLNGIVGGGSVTGYWAGTGFGSFQDPIDSLNNTYLASNLDTIVSPISLILTSTGPCPVQKDSITLTVLPAPIVNASADQTVCANNADVTLNGGVSGGAFTGIWTSPGGSGSFMPNDSTLNATYIPSAADTAAGSVTLVLTSTNFGTCNAVTDTMNVTITTAPIVDAGPATISVCSNNPDLTLAGTVGGSSSTGKWTTTGNGLFTPNNLALNSTYSPSPQDVASGSITLYLESTNNGTCNPVQDSIVVTFTASPSVNAGANILACTNVGSIDLSGLVSGPTTTGVWSGGNGSYNPNDQDLNASYTPTASEVSGGVLFLTLTSTNNGNCNSESDDVQITFVAPPFANFSFTDVCLNDSTSFQDFSLPGFGSIATWEWDFGDSNTSTTQNNTHLYTAPGVYNVSLITTTNVGCSDTAVQAVEVFELPVADFTYQVDCSGSQVVIDFTDASTTVSDSINFWFYDFGGQGTAAAQNPSNLFVGSGNFIITQIVNTVNGCADSTVQVITIPDRPEAGFFYNTTNGLNIGAEFSFIDTSYNAVSWFYDFGDGTTSTDQDPDHIYFANGTYVVTQFVTGLLGCMDSTSLVITINTVTTEINTLIPNAISPNGDGKNDVWKLDFIRILYPEATVDIFNRWGQLLFSSTGYTDPWDGTYNGEPVPDGNYYYVINLNDASEPEPYTGALLLLKNGD